MARTYLATALCSALAVPPAAMPAQAETTFCPVEVHDIVRVDDTHWAYGLRSLASGHFTGRLALYDGNDRYDVPVDTDVYDLREKRSRIIPHVVVFPKPVKLTDAVITADASAPCGTPYDPWSVNIPPSTIRPRFRIYRDDIEENFHAGIPQADSVNAPTAVSEPPPACADPYTRGATVQAALPEIPALAQQMALTGTVAVLLTLDVDASVTNARVEARDFESPLLDAPSLRAARNSKYRGKRWRCTNVVGSYLFLVVYGR